MQDFESLQYGEWVYDNERLKQMTSASEQTRRPF